MFYLPVILSLYFVSITSPCCKIEFVNVNGIAISNIIINIIIFIITLIMLNKLGVSIFDKQKLNFTWIREALKVCAISGVESFVRNIF